MFIIKGSRSRGRSNDFRKAIVPIGPHPYLLIMFTSPQLPLLVSTIFIVHPSVTSAKDLILQFYRADRFTPHLLFFPFAFSSRNPFDSLSTADLHLGQLTRLLRRLPPLNVLTSDNGPFVSFSWSGSVHTLCFFTSSPSPPSPLRGPFVVPDTEARKYEKGKGDRRVCRCPTRLHRR